MDENKRETPGVSRPPLREVEKKPWSFVTMALAAGFGMVLAWKSRKIRKGLRLASRFARGF